MASTCNLPNGVSVRLGYGRSRSEHVHGGERLVWTACIDSTSYRSPSIYSSWMRVSRELSASLWYDLCDLGVKLMFYWLLLVAVNWVLSKCMDLWPIFLFYMNLYDDYSSWRIAEHKLWPNKQISFTSVTIFTVSYHNHNVHYLMSYSFINSTLLPAPH